MVDIYDLVNWSISLRGETSQAFESDLFNLDSLTEVSYDRAEDFLAISMAFSLNLMDASAML